MASQVIRELVTVMRFQADKAGLRNAEKGLRRVKEQATKAESGVRKLSRAMKAAAGVVIGSAAIKGLYNLATAGQEARHRLRQLLQEGDDFGKLNTRLRETANAVGLTIGEMSRQANKAVPALQDVGYSTEAAAEFLEAFNLAGAAAGASGGEINRALNGVIGSASKGVLDARTFNDMLKRLPGSVRHVVTGLQELYPELGVTTENIRAMVEDGEISFHQFGSAIVNQTEEIRAAADAMPKTFGESWNAVKNNLADLFGALEENTGIIDKMARGIEWLATQIPKIGDAFSGFAGIGESLNIDNLRAMFESAMDSAGPILDKVRELGAVLGEIFTSDAVTAFFGFITNIGGQAIANILEQFIALGKILAGVLSGDTDKIKEGAAAFLEVYRKMLGQLSGYLKAAIDGIFSWIASGFNRLAEGAYEALMAAFRSVVDWIFGKLNSAIAVANKIPGINIDMLQTSLPEFNPAAVGAGSASNTTTTYGNVTVNQSFANTEPATVRRAAQTGARMGMPTAEAAP